LSTEPEPDERLFVGLGPLVAPDKTGSTTARDDAIFPAMEERAHHFSDFGSVAAQMPSNSRKKAVNRVPPPSLLPDDLATSLSSPETDQHAAHNAEHHRERMRGRFTRLGAGALEDYELLELYLFRTIPRRDTRPIARALMTRFGNLPSVLAQPEKLLKEVSGIGDAAAFDIRLLGELTKAAAKADIGGTANILGSWNKLIGYCRAILAHETREQFRVLFLNKKNALIADEVMQTGTVDHTPVYPREVIRRALELSASAIVLVHNHPSGDPTPSAADIEMTHRIKEIADALEITVQDHLIIGRDGYTSLKGQNLM
jgi:DNA repair protein RadC